ncbi:MAG: hypothetical protein ACYS8W_00045 [Planctomycetota bacterium]
MKNRSLLINRKQPSKCLACDKLLKGYPKKCPYCGGKSVIPLKGLGRKPYRGIIDAIILKRDFHYIFMGFYILIFFWYGIPLVIPRYQLGAPGVVCSALAAGLVSAAVAATFTFIDKLNFERNLYWHIPQFAWNLLFFPGIFVVMGDRSRDFFGINEPFKSIHGFCSACAEWIGVYGWIIYSAFAAGMVFSAWLLKIKIAWKWVLLYKAQVIFFAVFSIFFAVALESCAF